MQGDGPMEYADYQAQCQAEAEAEGEAMAGMEAENEANIKNEEIRAQDEFNEKQKLKTLKTILNITSEEDAHGIILEGQFQKAAEEWLKELESAQKEGRDTIGYCIECTSPSHVIDWIKHFFNLVPTKKVRSTNDTNK